MDTAAVRAREREAFHEFLTKHHYTPQGRFARAGGLEEHDLDAFSRGQLGPVWAWAFRNLKNAEDLTIIKRNVNVARQTIDSCKRERDDAKRKRETLLASKQRLQEELRAARERERVLMANLRAVETESEEVVAKTIDQKQRELLRRAFNAKNADELANADSLVAQARALVSVDSHPLVELPSAGENPIDVLMTEVRRMLKATATSSDAIEFGDSDIAHLRQSRGGDLIKWILEAASQPLDEVPDDAEEAKYAAHVHEQSKNSHDALLQIQRLLRESQADHINRFIKTQKLYAKANELKITLDQAKAAMTEDTADQLWTKGSEHDALANETVELQIESQALTVGFNFATRAYEDVAATVETLRQQKQELETKMELMNRFEDRQDDVVRQMRAKYKQNQELLESLTHKQTRLLQHVAANVRDRIEKETASQVTMREKLVLEELRGVAGVRLPPLDTAMQQLAVRPHTVVTEDARQVRVAVPFEDFYINQVQANGPTLNGYQRVAKALGVPDYGGWTAILGRLRVDDGAWRVQDLRGVVARLEREMAEDRARTVPEAQALLATLDQLMGASKQASLSQLEDVVDTNDTTLRGVVPELELAIENWHEQAAWGAVREAPR